MSAKEQPQWDREEATFDNHPINLLNTAPLPTTVEGARYLYQNNEHLQREHQEAPHPDELWDRYIHTVAESRYWHAFEILLFGFESRLYFWNSHAGHGFWVSTLENQDGSLKEIFQALDESDA